MHIAQGKYSDFCFCPRFNWLVEFKILFVPDGKILNVLKCFEMMKKLKLFDRTFILCFHILQVGIESNDFGSKKAITDIILLNVWPNICIHDVLIVFLQL